jgi:subtilisin-like proprotein convertase family protein
MINKRYTSICLSALFVLISFAAANAQSFAGSNLSTAGTATIPSAGTGGCTVAPQLTGGTIFNVTVAGLTTQFPTSVTINLNHTFDSDLDITLHAPNGQILELSTDNGAGNDNYTNTVFADCAATNITAGAAPFTGLFRPEGTLVASACGTTITPTVTTLAGFTGGQNGTWQLVIKDDVGADAGTMLNWSIDFTPPCGFVAATLPNLAFAGTNPAFCGFTGNLTAPVLSANCAPGQLINVSIDGVAAGTVASGAVFPVVIASGAHVVTYSVPPCASISQNVTVSDGVAPVITCPGDMLINLDPGACNAVVNYNVTATDNCPFFVQQAPLQFPTTFSAHGAGAITVAGNNLPGGFFFNLTNTSANPVRVNGYRVRFGSAAFGVVPSPRTVNTYISVGATFVGQTANAAGWVSTGVDANVIVAGANSELSQVNIATPYVLNPGQTKGVYLFGVQSSLVYNAAAGFVANIAQGPFNLNSGSSSTALFGGSIANRTPNVEIQFQSVGNPIVTQTAGLPSGSAFPIGTTTNCFSTVDLAGNPANCCFNVEVLEYPNPITSLVCNDLVYVSLDESCSYCLGADGVLEGGPYSCYDDYVVEVDRTAPFGNGPWQPACFGPADINKTYQVRVTDPSTGNKCWGNVKIEDKLPPVLVCRDIVVPCNALPQDIPNEPAPAVVGPQVITIANINDPIGEPGAPVPDIQTYNFDYSYLPAGTATLDVNCRFKMSGHTFLPDINIVVRNPQGTQADVFTLTGCTGAEWPMDLIFDDEGVGNLTMCVELDAAGARLQSVIAPGVSSPTVLNVFDGLNASGTWQVIVSDNVGADDGVVEIVGLEVTVNLPQIIPTDNCSFADLTYIDTEVAESCASGYTKTVNRKWTATDASGNTSTCIQRIRFDRPTLDDVVAPPDYDDIDAPAFSCEQNIPLVNGHPNPTPDWIEGQGLQGYPWVFGLPSGCNVNWEFHDYIIEVCDGTVKYRREWTIIDWCTGSGFIYNQIIKVLDETGPAFSCPANLTVSVDPFSCCATINLPDVIVEDNCSRVNNISGMVVIRDPQTGDVINMLPISGSLTNFPGNNFWDLDTLAAFGWTPCLPLGTHSVTYVAEDDCGNTSSCNFNIIVRDYVPPVAACDETTTVAIGIDDPFDCYTGPDIGCEFAGVTWVKATTFNDGSYDNCFDVKLTIRRMNPYTDCINNLDGTPLLPERLPSEFELATSRARLYQVLLLRGGHDPNGCTGCVSIDVNGNI